MRYFNIAGPNRELDNFSLDPLKRIEYQSIETLIARGQNFSVCSSRQSGKTTFLLALKKRLNREGRYRCLYCNVEAAQVAGNDTERGIKLVLNRLAQEVEFEFQDFWPYQNFAPILEHTGADGALVALFERWLYKEQPAKPPIVLLLDGIDLLRGGTLVSVLRQLRTGQISSPRLFPQSVVLSGVRDVRDSDIDIGGDEILRGRSGSDIRERSIVLSNFTQNEVKELCEQYAAESKQTFQEYAYSRLFALTGGRPWLVNALLCEALYEMGFGRDVSRPISFGMIDAAKDHFIARQEIYMNQLAVKLSPPSVRETLFPILVGGGWKKKPLQEDLDYLEDLELIQRSATGWGIPNAIYRELIPKVMGMSLKDELVHIVDRNQFLKPDKRLDFQNIVYAFQRLYCDHFLEWGRRYDLEGVLAQILLQTFLHYVLGDRGRMECDYALSTGRVDISVGWGYTLENGERREERFVVEIALFDITKSHEAVVRSGVAQVVSYAKPRQAHEVYLIILDEDDSKTWYDRLFQEEHTHDGMLVHVYGL
jgi:predicted AAA+ superfamily ATPase